MTPHQPGAVREAVLAVHRALLEAEKLAWERMNGRTLGNVEVLQLAIADPWFAWLRSLTTLIASMDAAWGDDAPERTERIALALADAEALLDPDEDGNDFQQRYFEFVQRAPEVALAHGQLIHALTH